MVRLQKRPQPQVLRDNKAQWSAEFLNARADPSSAPKAATTRYRHPDIKAAILEETHDKCAYCESRVTHIYPGDIEHILPKSRRPELALDWSNLTLACLECNRRKSDYYDPAMPLIDPYTDNPQEHFVFAGPLVLHKRGSDRGRVTKTRLELNRPPLFERRKERLETLMNLLDLHAKATQPALKDALSAEIQLQAKEDAEYSAMVSIFLSGEGLV